MAENEVALIPGGIVADIGGNQSINENQFIVKEAAIRLETNCTRRYSRRKSKTELLECLNGPLTMLPRMIVLRIHAQYLFGQGQFMRWIVQPFNDNASMMPNLIILRIVNHYFFCVFHFFIQIDAKRFQYLTTINDRQQLPSKSPKRRMSIDSPILPHRIIGRIQA